MTSNTPQTNSVVKRRATKKPYHKKKQPPKKIRIIPLGGLSEIGKNMTVFEYEEEAVIIDCGLAFPDNEMLGIDLVIPDTAYLEKIKDKIHAILLTHGHEDHIGALPYVLKDINVPIYGTRLTLGIVTNKLREARMEDMVILNEVKCGDKVRLGSFLVEFIRVNHSIADSAAIALHTPAGIILHTGDFKIDVSPIEGEMMDLTRIGELGKAGVLAMFADSTNAERPGHSESERKVGDTFDNIFTRCDGRRIIIATFASNVHRVQQIINEAAKFGRKVAVSGRSMENIISAAIELGYMNVPEGVLVDIDGIKKYPPEKLVIITTGSQGEPMSALYRMAFSDHKKVEIGPSDVVVISAKPIPGNEKLVSKVVNELLKSGAEVIYDSNDIHVSGHACQDELKMILALAKPKFFFPVHGEYRHLKRHAELARYIGMDPRNILIMDIGSVVEVDEQSAKIVGIAPSGKVLVDGLGVGDVGNIVLRDRQHLAQDGLIVIVATIDGQNGSIIAGPDIVSRGFVYMRESETLIENIKTISRDALEACEQRKITDWATIKSNVKDSVSAFLYKNTKRKPMVLVVLTEI